MHDLESKIHHATSAQSKQLMPANGQYHYLLHPSIMTTQHKKIASKFKFKLNQDSTPESSRADIVCLKNASFQFRI